VNKYYNIVNDEKSADLYIYGDIGCWENEVNAKALSAELNDIKADTINVYINSYGGEVAEGLAIYNILKRHEAKITTVCDGFACSIAAVIFMAGDTRIMNESSLLMIHNAWMLTAGNADDLRRQADDLEIISKTTKDIFLKNANIEEAELDELLKNETWLSPEDSLKYGFATKIEENKQSEKAAASTRKEVFKQLMKLNKSKELDDPDIMPDEPDVNTDDGLKEVNKKLDDILKLLKPEEPEEPEEPEQPEQKANTIFAMLNNL